MKTQHLKAILFDLDGTLLKNDMQDFMNRYFIRLTARFAHLVSADDFISAMNKAAHGMVTNSGPKTNAEVFDEIFFPLLGFAKADIFPIFEDFYRIEFPQLHRKADFNPEAPLLIKKAKGKGIICILATNPLFPQTATSQRIEWAGLHENDFALVTTYKNSRAAKPNLKYYRDILEFIKQPSDSCLMVGDQAWDMVAGKLGMQTFLIRSANTDLDADTPPHTAEGSLGDLAALL